MDEDGTLRLRLPVSEFGPENAKRLKGELVLEGKTGWVRDDPAFTSLAVDVPLAGSP